MIIVNIEGQDIHWDGTYVTFQGRGRIDDDGTGDDHNDSDHQNETSLKPNLNADEDRYIVVPPQIIKGVPPIVLGSQAWVSYQGQETAAVVGDVGPRHRLGEISIALAQALGINSNANTGGIDTPDLIFKIQPGRAAFVDSKVYHLQAYK